MFGHKFYHGTIRKYIQIFGNMFNDTTITRTNTDGSEGPEIHVPITYSAKDKMLARVKQNPNLDNEAAVVLPRMSFEIKSMRYAPRSKLNPLGRIVRESTDANKFQYNYNPVPYDFEIKLYVYARYAEDGTKIIEQILPFFTPEWNQTIIGLAEQDLSVDIPIVLNDTNSENTYEGEFKDRQVIVWTLDFTLKGYLWGPIVNKKIIKFVNTHFYVGNDNTTPVAQLIITPGLLPNGSPTTNAAASIDPLLIEYSDDWSYAITEHGMIIYE
jgi:hypothetical protein